MKKILIALAVLLLPSLALAQLPEPFDPLQNPGFTAGVSVLRRAPGPGLQRVQPFIEASVPILKIGDFPCAFFGIGLTAEELDPALGDIQFGVSLPFVTCSVKGSGFIVRAGYAKIIAGAEEKPDAYFAGVGFSRTSPTAIAKKRAEREASKAARLLLTHPPGSVAGK